jgi:hypothetical protein
MTRNEILKATDPHISMIGHVTLEELKDVMSTVQIANGFANRQLWCWARRSKILPDGGARLDHHSLARKISNHLANLKNRIQVVDFTEEARATWRAGYSKLSEAQPGMLGSVTSRAEALTMRLALIYALIDGATVIEDDHLRAGLAVWDYCQRSAAFIFGDRLGNTVADTILEWLQVEPAGISRWEISNKFGRNVPKERIESALSLLVKYSRAHPEFRPTSGRSIETWVIGA